MSLNVNHRSQVSSLGTNEGTVNCRSQTKDVNLVESLALNYSVVSELNIKHYHTPHTTPQTVTTNNNEYQTFIQVFIAPIPPTTGTNSKNKNCCNESSNLSVFMLYQRQHSNPTLTTSELGLNIILLHDL